MKDTIIKINKTKTWFLEKDKLDNLARLLKEKREKNQVNKIRNEKGDFTTDNIEIHRIMRSYLLLLFSHAVMSESL